MTFSPAVDFLGFTLMALLIRQLLHGADVIKGIFSALYVKTNLNTQRDISKTVFLESYFNKKLPLSCCNPAVTTLVVCRFISFQFSEVDENLHVETPFVSLLKKFFCGIA